MGDQLLEMVDCGGTLYGAGNHDAYGTMNRTAARRAQRAHTKACMWAGLQQQKHELSLARNHLDQSRDGSILAVLLDSLAIHKTDCLALGENVHYASHANLLAKQLGTKSKATYKQHVSVHQAANRIKHEVLDHDLFQALPPLPTGAIQCSDFEVFLEDLYANSHEAGYTSDGTAVRFTSVDSNPIIGSTCAWCGTWQPLDDRCNRSGHILACATQSEVASESAAAYTATAEIAEVVATTAVGIFTGQLAEVSLSIPQAPRQVYIAVADAGRAAAVSWSMWSLMAPALADYQAHVGSASMN
jgi:hypothetical protein